MPSKHHDEIRICKCIQRSSSGKHQVKADEVLQPLMPLLERVLVEGICLITEKFQQCKQSIAEMTIQLEQNDFRERVDMRVAPVESEKIILQSYLTNKGVRFQGKQSKRVSPDD